MEGNTKADELDSLLLSSLPFSPRSNDFLHGVAVSLPNSSDAITPAERLRLVYELVTGDTEQVRPFAAVELDPSFLLLPPSSRSLIDSLPSTLSFIAGRCSYHPRSLPLVSRSIHLRSPRQGRQRQVDALLARKGLDRRTQDQASRDGSHPQSRTLGSQ